MPKASAGEVSAPVQVGGGKYQYAHVASSTDLNDGALFVGIEPVDFNSSKPVCPPSAPIYRRPRLWHRASSLISGTGSTAQDNGTGRPTAVPTWVGVLRSQANSGQAVMVVDPLADYGTPPNGAGMLYVIDSGANAEVKTVTAAATGGPHGTPPTTGDPWTITATANLGTAHAAGVRVACIGTSQTAALDWGGVTNSCPSGPVGGRGIARGQFTCGLVYGSATADATFTAYYYDDLAGVWAPTGDVQTCHRASAGTDAKPIRIDVDGDWYGVEITVLSGTGAAAWVTWSEAIA